MTMHMMGHAYDTVYRGRRKVKITKSDSERLKTEWHAYNKFARQNHLQKVTLEEYLDSVFGRNKVQTKPTHQTFQPLERPRKVTIAGMRVLTTPAKTAISRVLRQLPSQM